MGVLGTDVPVSIFFDNPETLSVAHEAALRGALAQAGYRVATRAEGPFQVCALVRGGGGVEHLAGSPKAAFLFAVRTLDASGLFEPPAAPHPRGKGKA